jgi:hypothetical protein
MTLWFWWTRGFFPARELKISHIEACRRVFCCCSSKRAKTAADHRQHRLRQLILSYPMKRIEMFPRWLSSSEFLWAVASSKNHGEYFRRKGGSRAVSNCVLKKHCAFLGFEHVPQRSNAVFDYRRLNFTHEPVTRSTIIYLRYCRDNEGRHKYGKPVANEIPVRSSATK